MAEKKKVKKDNPVTTSWQSTLAGVGIGLLGLYVNGMTPKQIGVSVAGTIVGGLINDAANKSKEEK